MAIIDRSIRLQASADAVWPAVKTPAAFRTVTRGLLTMPVIAEREADWQPGETISGWIFLFGVLPFSRHHLHIAVIDDSHMTLSSREHGGLIRRWNHDIIVTPAPEGGCVYRDRVEVDAGILTPLLAVYAQWFYRMRQRRWRVLAARLPAAG
jgi:hypothetical protein